MLSNNECLNIIKYIIHSNLLSGMINLQITLKLCEILHA